MASDQNPFIPDASEADRIWRFVELIEDLTLERLERVELDQLPSRDREYVRRLQLLVAEDHGLLARQRLVWCKLRHAIPLLEAEARELIEVLGCRGFYRCGLNLDGLQFGTLDLQGAVIGGDYRCRYTRILGLCNETGLVVRGQYLVESRRVEGELRAEGVTALGLVDEGSDSRFGRNPSLAQVAVLRPAGLSSGSLTPEEIENAEELTEEDLVALSILPPAGGEEQATSAAEIEKLGLPTCNEPASPVAQPLPSWPAITYRPSRRPRRHSLWPVPHDRCASDPPPGARHRRALRPSLPPFGASFAVRPRRLRTVGPPDTSSIDESWE